MDALLCQMDSLYLQHLIEYNRLLQQRNQLLRSLAESISTDRSLLDVYDAQLQRPGTYIFVKRQHFFREILPSIESIYQYIAGSDDGLRLFYQSDLLSAPYAELLYKSREKDLMLMRTHAGIHRDDIDIRLKTLQFKNIASQGQRKSLLFSMKLAEYEMLALSLAREPQRLAVIQRKMAGNRYTCPLFDTIRFARHIESAYHTMWQRSQQGEPPAGFAVAPLP